MSRNAASAEDSAPVAVWHAIEASSTIASPVPQDFCRMPHLHLKTVLHLPDVAVAMQCPAEAYRVFQRGLMPGETAPGTFFGRCEADRLGWGATVTRRRRHARW